MFEKKNIELQSYLQNLKEFINTTDYTEIDIRDLLLKILDILNESDLKDLLIFVEKRYPKLFAGLVEQLETIAIDNILYGKYLAKDFMIKENCIQLIQSYERTHNIEMHTTLLVGMLAKYNKSDNSFFKILHRTLIPEINEAIIHNYDSLQSKIKFGDYLSIENALCIFFFYERDEAFKRFKMLIHKDIERKKHSAYKMDYRLTVELFFKRLQLDYIPKIDWINPKISLSNSNESISRNEIDSFIDGEDLFNKRIPLDTLKSNQFLHSENNFKDIESIKEALAKFFISELKIDIEPVFENAKINIVDIFIENITMFIPGSTKELLIFVREHIRDGFKTEILITRFLILLYCFKEQEYLVGATKKIDLIISNYFGNELIPKSRIYSTYNRRTKEKDEPEDFSDILFKEITFEYF